MTKRSLTFAWWRPNPSHLSPSTPRRSLARWLLYALVLAFWGKVTGFAHTKGPIKLSQFVRQDWNTTDGLPQNTISNLAQTKDGFIWIGTQEGLARFDGFTFSVFDNTTTSEFRFNEVVSLAANHSGGLWIGVKNGGLIYWEAGSFSRPIAHEQLEKATVRSLLAEEDGTLFVGTDRSGLFSVFEGKAERLAGPLGNVRFQALAKWNAQGILVGTKGEGLLVFEEGVFREIPLSDDPLAKFVRVLEHSPEKGFFIGTEGAGIFLVHELGTVQFHHDPEQERNNIHAISIGKNDHIWWGSDQGLTRRVAGEVAHFNVRKTTQGHAVPELIHDTDNNLWVSVPGEGLHRYEKGTFTTIGVAEGLCNDMVWSVGPGPGDSILVGTDNGGFCQIVDSEVKHDHVPERFRKGLIESTAIDSQERIWVGKYDGLYRVQKDEYVKVGKGQEPFEGNIYPVFSDRSSRIWFGNGSRLFRIEPEGAQQIEHESLDAQSIHAVAQDAEGRMWLAASEGLFSVEGDRVRHYPPKAGIHESEHMCALLAEGPGFWVSHTSLGLGWFEQGKYQFFARSGLPPDIPYGLLEDHLGYLWYSSNRGIIRVAKQALRAWLADRSKTIAWTRFGLADGLRHVEGNLGGHSPAFKDKNGHLWFATIAGVVFVDPDNVAAKRPAPKPYFTKVLVDNRPLPFGRELELPAEFDSLEIQFGAVEYANSKSIDFYTEIQGITAPIKAIPGHLKAHFTQLPPGKMTFQVAAGNLSRGHEKASLILNMPMTPRAVARQRAMRLLGIAILLAIGLLLWKIWQFRYQHQRRLKQLGDLQKTERNKRGLLDRTAQRLTVAHQAADRAVVQTHLLHNVGNILNSVSVSSGLMEKMLRGSRLQVLFQKIVSLLGPHRGALPQFVQQDDQGKRVPQAIAEIADFMEDRKESLFNEMANLQLQCAHIQDIVRSLDQLGEGFELCRLSLLVEDALKLQGYLIAKHNIQVVREFEDDLYVSTQKSQLLQILVNLIKNAVEAMAEVEEERDRCLVIKASVGSGDSIVLNLIDNGIGIEPDALERLFDKGFTTKKHGHGLGLSYCRTKMREMHGDLSVTSAGENLGATFSLSFPGHAS